MCAYLNIMQLEKSVFNDGKMSDDYELSDGVCSDSECV